MVVLFRLPFGRPLGFPVFPFWNFPVPFLIILMGPNFLGSEELFLPLMIHLPADEEGLEVTLLPVFGLLKIAPQTDTRNRSANKKQGAPEKMYEKNSNSRVNLLTNNANTNDTSSLTLALGEESPTNPPW